MDALDRMMEASNTETSFTSKKAKKAKKGKKKATKKGDRSGAQTARPVGASGQKKVPAKKQVEDSIEFGGTGQNFGESDRQSQNQQSVDELMTKYSTKVVVQKQEESAEPIEMTPTKQMMSRSVLEKDLGIPEKFEEEEEVPVTLLTEEPDQ